MGKNKIINTIGDGGCPCGEYKDENVFIRVHCWKTDLCCEYSGVYYEILGDKKLGMIKVKEIAKDIEDGYLTGVSIKKI